MSYFQVTEGRGVPRILWQAMPSYLVLLRGTMSVPTPETKAHLQGLKAFLHKTEQSCSTCGSPAMTSQLVCEGCFKNATIGEQAESKMVKEYI